MALNRTKTVALTAAITLGAVIASTSFAEARRYCPRGHYGWHYGWHKGWHAHRPMYSRYYYRPAAYARSYAGWRYGWYRYPGWRYGWYGAPGYYGYGGPGLLGAGAGVVGAGLGAGAGLLGAGLFGIL